MKHQLSYIDLFAGCGGLSLGLYNAGWRGLFAIEKSPDAFKTLKYNLIDQKKHFDWLPWLPIKNHDINEIISIYEKELKRLRGVVDLVAGGPPCQGFSSAGRGKNNDERNELVKSYIQFVNLVEPKVIFFENVRGFTLKLRGNSEKAQKYSDYVVSQLEKNYNVDFDLIDFSKYGVPQKRCRFILVGVRKDIVKDKNIKAQLFFEKLNSNRSQFLISKNLEVSPTLEDAISDLLKNNNTLTSPDNPRFLAGKYGKTQSAFQKLMRQRYVKSLPDSHRFANHTPEIENRFKIALKFKLTSKQYREKFKLKKSTVKVLFPDGIAPTLTSLPDDCIHYSEPRILTVREYARIQSFPDWFEFKGKYTTGGRARIKEAPRYTQVGNAIPPLFGEQSGIIIKGLLDE